MAHAAEQPLAAFLIDNVSFIALIGLPAQARTRPATRAPARPSRSMLRLAGVDFSQRSRSCCC